MLDEAPLRLCGVRRQADLVPLGSQKVLAELGRETVSFREQNQHENIASVAGIRWLTELFPQQAMRVSRAGPVVHTSDHEPQLLNLISGE